MSWTKGTSQSNGTGSATTGAAETVSVSVTANQPVCVAVTTATDVTNNPSGVSVQSSLGTTYTKVASIADTTNHQRIDLFVGIPGSTATDVLNAAFDPLPGTTQAQAVTINADPFSAGGSSSSAADGNTGQLQAGPGTGTDAVSSGNITTTAAGDLIYTATVDTSTGANPAANGTGFSTGIQSAGPPLVAINTAYKTQLSAGSVAGTWTANTGGDRFITAVMAVTTGAAAAVKRNNLALMGVGR